MHELLTDQLLTNRPFANQLPPLDGDIADLAPPFLRPAAAPCLARGFLAAGHVTALTEDAYAHGSQLAMAWVVSLASFRPHGQFRPFAPFSSVVDDRAACEGERRRRLVDFAGVLGAPCSARRNGARGFVSIPRRPWTRSPTASSD